MSIQLLPCNPFQIREKQYLNSKEITVTILAAVAGSLFFLAGGFVAFYGVSYYFRGRYLKKIEPNSVRPLKTLLIKKPLPRKLNFTDLPLNIQSKIFQHLTPIDLRKAYATNSLFKQLIINDPSLKTVHPKVEKGREAACSLMLDLIQKTEKPFDLLNESTFIPFFSPITAYLVIDQQEKAWQFSSMNLSYNCLTHLWQLEVNFFHHRNANLITLKDIKRVAVDPVFVKQLEFCLNFAAEKIWSLSVQNASDLSTVKGYTWVKAFETFIHSYKKDLLDDFSHPQSLIKPYSKYRQERLFRVGELNLSVN